MILLKKICVFFILSKILIQLCPNEKYEKYLETLVEWVALTLLLAPLFLGARYLEKCKTWVDVFSIFDMYMRDEEIESKMPKTKKWQEEVLEIYEKAAEKETENINDGHAISVP